MSEVSLQRPGVYFINEVERGISTDIVDPSDPNSVSNAETSLDVGGSLSMVLPPGTIRHPSWYRTFTEPNFVIQMKDRSVRNNGVSFLSTIIGLLSRKVASQRA